MAVKRRKRGCRETSVCPKWERGGKAPTEFSPFGKDIFGRPAVPPGTAKLSQMFTMPPFSLLDARQGEWQDRKRAWLALGIRGEEGRGGQATDTTKYGVAYKSQDSLNAVQRNKNKSSPGGSPRPAMNYSKGERGDGYGKPIKGTGKRTTWVAGDRPIEALDDTSQRILASGGPGQEQSGTSIFDPVLCELMYKWFCPVGGSVLDPCAGESTKGIVAAYLGYEYTGIEVRQEQVDANRKQAEQIGVDATWLHGDSIKMDEIIPLDAQFDFVWTSPPYYDLEIYSEQDSDSSTFKTYEQFMDWYSEIFAGCVERLKKNRFLAVKIGEIRDRTTGFYRNFVGDNISVFRKLGLKYYNELVLVTAVGSLPVRAGKQFTSSRKIGKTHQNVLIFYKGDRAKDIREEFGAV